MATEEELMQQIEAAAAASQLAADIGTAAANIIKAVANGDEDTVVTTDNGPVPSLARWLALMALQLESEFSTELTNKLGKAGDTGSVKALTAEGAAATDVANVVTFAWGTGQEYQSLTLTQGGTVLQVANDIPEGGMLTIDLWGSDVFAPDWSAFTPLRIGDTIEAAPLIRIYVERWFGDAAGVYHYSFGGGWAS